MAPSAVYDAAGAEWMAQFRAMREAIDELQLPQSNGDTPPYGQDIVIDSQSSPSSTSNDDIWDLLGSNEDDFSSNDGSDAVDSPPHVNGEVNGESHDAQWLAQVCTEKANSRSGLGPDDLYEQLSALLTSGISGRQRELLA